MKGCCLCWKAFWAINLDRYRPFGLVADPCKGWLMWNSGCFILRICFKGFSLLSFSFSNCLIPIVLPMDLLRSLYLYGVLCDPWVFKASFSLLFFSFEIKLNPVLVLLPDDSLALVVLLYVLSEFKIELIFISLLSVQDILGLILCL